MGLSFVFVVRGMGTEARRSAWSWVSGQEAWSDKLWNGGVIRLFLCLSFIFWSMGASESVWEYGVQAREQGLREESGISMFKWQGWRLVEFLYLLTSYICSFTLF